MQEVTVRKRIWITWEVPLPLPDIIPKPEFAVAQHFIVERMSAKLRARVWKMGAIIDITKRLGNMTKAEAAVAYVHSAWPRAREFRVREVNAVWLPKLEKMK